MRRGCVIVALTFVLLMGLLLYSTRSMSINRGVSLRDFRGNDFTFHVWSYGRWVASDKSGVHVSTFAPPYTLVLAIEPHDATIDDIEILSADVVDGSGQRVSIREYLMNSSDAVQYHPHARIQHPYAAFMFNNAVKSHESVTVEIEFQATSDEGSTTVKQQLRLESYEIKSRSFTFWDTMMSA